MKPGSLSGPYALNNKLLDNGERLFEGILDGPEHLLAKDGAIYASLASGEIIKIVGENVTVVTKFEKPCCKFEFDFF